LADFDGNGTGELYYANEIRDALTGRRLVKGTGDWGRDVSFAPVAVDILDDSECTQCAGLELVSGATIYAVDVGNGSADHGSLTEIKTGAGFKIKSIGWNGGYKNWSGTSIADYNQDGFLDVIASGAADY